MVVEQKVNELIEAATAELEWVLDGGGSFAMIDEMKGRIVQSGAARGDSSPCDHWRSKRRTSSDRLDFSHRYPQELAARRRSFSYLATNQARHS